MPKTKFLIIENSCLISSGLTKIINQMPGAIARELNDIHLLERQLKKFLPEVLVINTQLLKHAEVKRCIKTELLREVHVVYLCESKKNETVRDKNICSLYLGDSENKIKQCFSEIMQKTSKVIDNKEDNDELSQRETEVLKLVAMGKTNKEIAHELFISVHTVITHRKHITKKLDIKTVPGMTVYAILNNLIDMNEVLN
ncbi:MAG: hypothetical protein CSB06_01940 [Bacteroidia bacterium]|nr:MAG: hypothetical protein CSB06_01940 [Bacteroidia bacterium]